MNPVGDDKEMAAEEKVKLRKGLKDVYFDRSDTSFIDGKRGKLLYRGYDIHDLAEHSTFEETSYLLLHGSLPSSSELAQFGAQLRASRGLPEEVLQIIQIMRRAHPMDVLRTAVSAMSSVAAAASDISRESVLGKSISLTGAVATMVACHARIREGKEPVEPDEGMGHAANFLYMLFGEVPNPVDARLIDKDLVLHAEHGVNASTFAARIAGSTQADFYAAIVAALAVLKGPKHGGAAEAAMKMAQEVGSEDNAANYVAKLLNGGGRVAGFGHPVYKALDPRSVHLKSDAKALGERRGQPKWFSIIEAVANTDAMKRRAKLGIAPNVDLWSGAIYSLLGIPEDLFVPLFAMGRMPGWCTHILEQYSKRDILRPRLEYSGLMDREYVPIDQR